MGVMFESQLRRIDGGSIRAARKDRQRVRVAQSCLTLRPHGL